MATATSSAPAQRAPFAQGSIIWRKVGPLPAWAWALIVVGLIIAWQAWRARNAATEQASGGAVDPEQLPGDQTAPPVFIVPQAPTPPVIVNPVITVPTAPPGGGANPPTQPPGGGTPNPVPKPPPGKWVTITKYPDNTPPKDSTLWDIAARELGAGSKWPNIWNHPTNASLRTSRKKPELIRAGDRVWVPK